LGAGGVRARDREAARGGEGGVGMVEWREGPLLCGRGVLYCAAGRGQL
jgi:hypothetical protein